MKQCSGCGGLFPPTEEHFGKCSRASDGLRSECRRCKRNDDAAYRNSIPGYLRRTYSDIARRCSGRSNDPRHAYCVKQGICLLFASADEFVGYVINVLAVDPRGKDCHRIETSGNYEPGNIIFLAPKVHGEVHAGTRQTC
jgi:hypothetical protein